MEMDTDPQLAERPGLCAAQLVHQYMRDNSIEVLRVGLERSTAVDIDDEDLDHAIGHLPLAVITWGGGELDYHVLFETLAEWLATAECGP